MVETILNEFTGPNMTLIKALRRELYSYPNNFKVIFRTLSSIYDEAFLWIDLWSMFDRVLIGHCSTSEWPLPIWPRKLFFSLGKISVRTWITWAIGIISLHSETWPRKHCCKISQVINKYKFIQLPLFHIIICYLCYNILLIFMFCQHAISFFSIFKVLLLNKFRTSKTYYTNQAPKVECRFTK